jgi:hypothetical protein
VDDGADALVTELERLGAEVERRGPVEQPFFEVTGELLAIDGVEVQLFEYPDARARRRDSRLVSADGTTIGTHQVTWVAPPHIWARGPLILVALGADHQTADRLEQALGVPLVAPDPGDS